MEFGYEVSRLPYTLPDKTYVPDFTLFLSKGRVRFFEFKGYFDIPAQVKMKAVKATNPDLDIRFVFYDASKPVRKGSKMTYADYCTKYGFPWAEGTIPKTWIR